MISEPVFVVSLVAQVLRDLGIPYVVGGSLASSVYGIPRATLDADIVAEIRPDQAGFVARGLGESFYADEEMILSAIRGRDSFNVIHLETMFKVDVFIPPQEEWFRLEMERGREEIIGSEGDDVRLRFASPEDVLLHKLLWYRMGDMTSDRQWGDAMGVLKVQAGALDREYLDNWSRRLGVEDLLRQAYEEAGDVDS